METRLEIELIDPQQHRAPRDQREAHHPGIEQHLLDQFVGRRPDHRRRQEGQQHADDETPGLRIVEHAGSEMPQPPRIDRQQSQDRAELNQNREAFAESVVAEAEKLLHEQQMPGRRDRNELGQSLNHAEDRRLDDIEYHGRAPRRRQARYAGAADLAGRFGRLVTQDRDSGNGKGRALHRRAARNLPAGTLRL